MNILQLLRKVLSLDYILTGAMFSVLVIVTFWGVIRRYALGNPITWLEEVQLMLFVGITYLGAGAAFRTGSHIAIEFVVDKLPKTGQAVAKYIISFIVVFTLFYFMLRGLDVLKLMNQTHRSTNILKVPYAVIYSALPIGAALMIINYLLATFVGLDEEAVQEVHQI